MDVRSWRIFFAVCLLISGTSCGDRFAVDTERGRQAAVDEANFQLSHGNCAAAQAAIDPVYNSPYVNEDIVLIKAAAHACAGGFNLIQIADKLSEIANVYGAMALSMPNALGDGRITAMYTAMDVLTANGTLINATQRSQKRNNYMVFIQMGIMGAIMKAYGDANPTSGSQISNMLYSNPRAGGDMANIDACALTAAVSVLVDSFSYSSLSGDPQVVSAKNSLNATCALAGFPTCDLLNKDRSACTGAGGNAPSIAAVALVGGINGAW